MRVLIILITIFSINIAGAEVPKLKTIMEEMGLYYKSLITSVKSGELTQEDIVTIEKLQIAMVEGAAIYPFSVSTDTHKARYSEFNIQIIHKALLLESTAKEALKNTPQNLEGVNELIAEINELRKEGHEEFKID